MISFSIVICTHNPDPELFQRLLSAVLKFDVASPPHEVIIVDNLSNPVLSENEAVKNFLNQKNQSRLIHESQPGLTPSRITGIKEAKYEWIVFFDDDNEPSTDYLVQAENIIKQYPQTGMWGPGNIQVLYSAQKENSYLNKIKWLFQQRDYTKTYVDNNSEEGSEYYPYGTGMIVHRNITTEYSAKVSAGSYTMTDRKGKSLSSAGDIQILFTGLKMGYYAGSSNLLHLNHIITGKKTTEKHVCKLVYALNSSQLKAYNEVFPERKVETKEITNADVIKTYISALRLYRMHKHSYTLQMFISRKMGELNARVTAFEYNPPLLLKLFEQFYLS